ncbi:DUF5719 family protein [Timonella senegalensis]|uniref:DUF5719 family protein n=2 Tax=Timonella senegalensis TaxID=1465825 RepID=UPI002FDE4D6A
MGVKTQAQVDKRSRFFGGVGRTLTALIAVGSLGALGAQGTSLVTDTGEIKTAGTQVSVAAPAATLGCPAAPYLEGGFDTNLGEFGSTQSETTSNGSLALVGSGGEVDLGLLAEMVSSLSEASGGESSKSSSTSGEAASLPDHVSTSSRSSVTQFGPGAGAAALATSGRFVTDLEGRQFTAASVGSVTTSGDLRGLAASACENPTAEQWLVGGSTSVGLSSNLVVQNPSLTPATVKITLWGPSGRVELAGSDTFLVPARAQVSTLLEGIAAEQRRIVVHVEAEGALVNSYIQNLELDGVTPRGVDYVTGSAAPSRAQVITGVSAQKTEVGDEASSFVRLVVPTFADVQSLADQSAEDAADVSQEAVGKARLYLLGEDGHVVMFGAQEIELAPGVVQDVSLAGAPEGIYTVVLESDVPVVASARSFAVGTSDPDVDFGGTPADFAWVPSAPVYTSSSHTSKGELGSLDWAHTTFGSELSASAVSGLSALPAGTSGTLAITALPSVGTVDELDTALDAIPRVYTSLAGSDANATETEESAAARKAWVKNLSAHVVVYSDKGRIVEEFDVALAPGQTKSFDLAGLGGKDAVGAVTVTAVDGAVMNWSVIVEDEDVSGSISTIAPVVAPEEPTAIRVSRSSQVGL